MQKLVAIGERFSEIGSLAIKSTSYPQIYPLIHTLNVAKPVQIENPTVTFDAPYGMPDVNPLDAVLAYDPEGRPHIISEWQFTDDELEAIRENDGRFFVGLISTHQPPMYIESERPFEYIDEHENHLRNHNPENTNGEQES